MDGAIKHSADNGIRFARPSQLRRVGLLCPGMMVETITIVGHEHFDSGYRPFRSLVGRTPTDYRRSLPPDKA